jgi:hypothetical protein
MDEWISINDVSAVTETFIKERMHQANGQGAKGGH